MFLKKITTTQLTQLCFSSLHNQQDSGAPNKPAFIGLTPSPGSPFCCTWMVFWWWGNHRRGKDFLAPKGSHQTLEVSDGVKFTPEKWWKCVVFITENENFGDRPLHPSRSNDASLQVRGRVFFGANICSSTFHPALTRSWWSPCVLLPGRSFSPEIALRERQTYHESPQMSWKIETSFEKPLHDYYISFKKSHQISRYCHKKQNTSRIFETWNTLSSQGLASRRELTLIQNSSSSAWQKMQFENGFRLTSRRWRKKRV